MALGNGECKRQHIEWISVENRVPENPRTVITAHCYNCSGIPVAVGTARYHSDVGKWISEIEFDDTNEITHWMPLPEAPKGW